MVREYQPENFVFPANRNEKCSNTHQYVDMNES